MGRSLLLSTTVLNDVTDVVNPNSGPKDVGTGFVGRDVENNSTVLVTCYHVIIDGIPASGKYDKADYRALNATMKEKIEENAKKFKIRIQYKHEDIKLEDFVISGTSKFSPNSSVCLYVDNACLMRSLHSYIHTNACK